MAKVLRALAARYKRLCGRKAEGGGLLQKAPIPRTSQPQEPLYGGARAIVTLAISVITAMTVLDTTIANVALPTIAGNLGVAPSQGTWVITFFGVANAIAIPITGWVARRVGEIRLYIWATILFVLASFLCGVSNSLEMLILARVAQGIAAGPLIPLSQSVLLACYPPEKRGFAMAMWAMTIVVGPILGPILGGYICDNFTWHWIFFVNVPVGLLSLLALRAPLAGRETQITRGRIDGMGLALLVLGVGALQLMLDEGKDKDWFASSYIVILAVIAGVSLILLVAWELTDDQPIVDLSLFRHRNFTVGTICISLGFMVYFASVVLLPMMLQTRMGYTAMWAGLSLAPVGIIPAIISPVIGKYSHRLSMRLLTTISFLTFAACFFWRTSFAPNMDFAYVVWPQFVQGLAVGLFFLPLMNIAFSGLGQKDMASAASLNNCLRVLAGSIGSSIATTQWERLEAMHHVRLTEGISQFNPVVVRTMEQMQAAGFSPEQAKAWLASEITRQGFLMGFNELFYLGGILFMILAGLVWLSKPVRMAGQPIPAGK